MCYNIIITTEKEFVRCLTSRLLLLLWLIIARFCEQIYDICAKINECAIKETVCAKLCIIYIIILVLLLCNTCLNLNFEFIFQAIALALATAMHI